MSAKAQSRGKCSFCEKSMTRGGMVRHLESCPSRREAVAAAARKKRKERTLFHLQVSDAWTGDYWLNLEMDGSALLDDLDYYLRAIWLECCGHCSRFSTRRWGEDEFPMDMQADDVLADGLTLNHIYDFGTESETLVKVVGTRHGKPLTPYLILLMARNEPPEELCIECGRPATHVCVQCMYEDDVMGVLCDEHARTHPHDEYGEPMRLFNSPRTGMCGYDGPAEPPY